MAKVRIPVANTVGKTVRIDPDATIGATIGTDLRLPDGTTPSLAELAVALASEVVAAEQIRSFQQLIDSIANSQVPASAVTQHEAVLTILESQITNGIILARVGGNESITGDWIFSSLLTIPEATVTTHQAALTILESQITDGSIFERVGGNEVITGTREWQGNVGFYSTTPITQPSNITDAVVAHALNATFDDTEVEAALDALGVKFNDLKDNVIEALGLSA